MCLILIPYSTATPHYNLASHEGLLLPSRRKYVEYIVSRESGLQAFLTLCVSFGTWLIWIWPLRYIHYWWTDYQVFNTARQRARHWMMRNSSWDSLPPVKAYRDFFLHTNSQCLCDDLLKLFTLSETLQRDKNKRTQWPCNTLLVQIKS